MRSRAVGAPAQLLTAIVVGRAGEGVARVPEKTPVGAVEKPAFRAGRAWRSGSVRLAVMDAQRVLSGVVGGPDGP